MSSRKQKGNKLFVTATEYKSFGGFLKKEEQEHHKLPFDHCAIGLSKIPENNFVCTKDGYIFDILNAIPYLQKYKVHPVTGESLEVKDLIKLHLKKNSKGDYECPITHNELTEYTKIAAIKTSGNVYTYEAIEEMNLKMNQMKDFLTGEEFTKDDIIILQDPKDTKRHQQNLASFHHIKEEKKKREIESQTNSTFGINVTSENEKLFKEIEKIDQKNKEKQKALGVEDKEYLYKSNSKGVGLKSSSLTSSSMGIKTKDEKIVNPKEGIYNDLKKKKKKSYLTLNTSEGGLNIELFSHLVPKTCDNFISLCEKGYYDGTIFHRLIPKFMIQGGDPTGTGTGGTSIFGKKFEDEFHQNLKHDSEGILSMANSGKDTNGSQFFITFAPTPHLNKKHTVFGKLVGGLDVLKKLEQIPTDSADRPLNEIKIINTEVILNPYSDSEKSIKKNEELQQEMNKPKKKEFGLWFSDPTPKIETDKLGVGKYISTKKETITQKRKSELNEPKKAKKTRTNFDFSNW
eukprot:gene12066-5560_t